MERYCDFSQINEDALRTALGQLCLEATEAQVRQLLEAYLAPAVFPDARAALDALGDFPLAILSNGSPAMLDAAVRNNGLESTFSSIISVDQVKTYKPSPRVYRLGPETLHLPAERDSVCIVQRMGRRGRKGIWLQRLLVQTDPAVPWTAWAWPPTSSCPVLTGSPSVTEPRA